jgi:hypothetical protein
MLGSVDIVVAGGLERPRGMLKRPARSDMSGGGCIGDVIDTCGATRPSACSGQISECCGLGAGNLVVPQGASFGNEVWPLALMLVTGLCKSPDPAGSRVRSKALISRFRCRSSRSLSWTSCDSRTCESMSSESGRDGSVKFLLCWGVGSLSKSSDKEISGGLACGALLLLLLLDPRVAIS